MFTGPFAARTDDILPIVFDNLRLLPRLLYQPAGAMSAILDHGSLLFASAALLATSLCLKIGAPWLPLSFYAPLLVLAAVYVPGALLVSGLLARMGGMGAVFQRDYSPLLTCTAMALAAVELPLAVAAWVVPPLALLCLGGLALLYFAVLMFFAVTLLYFISAFAVNRLLKWVEVRVRVPGMIGGK